MIPDTAVMAPFINEGRMNFVLSLQISSLNFAQLDLNSNFVSIQLYRNITNCKPMYCNDKPVCTPHQQRVLGISYTF